MLRPSYTAGRYGNTGDLEGDISVYFYSGIEDPMKVEDIVDSIGAKGYQLEYNAIEEVRRGISPLQYNVIRCGDKCVNIKEPKTPPSRGIITLKEPDGAGRDK